MMSSGSSNVCDEDESDNVVPPCPMLWLDDVRNAGEAVEYVTNPRHQWASQTSQSAYNKLNYAGVAREKGCDVGDTKGSLCATDSQKRNETGNHVVEENVTVEDRVTESVYDLIARVDTDDGYCFQPAQLISKFIVDGRDSHELMVEKLDSESLMIVDKQDSEKLFVDNQDSNVLVVGNLDSEEMIVDNQESSKLTLDKQDSNVLVVDNLDSEEMIVDNQESSKLIVDKQYSNMLVADNLDSEEMIVDNQDSSILVVDKQDSNVLVLVAENLDSEDLIVDNQDSSILVVDKLDSEELIVDKLDSNEDDRPACVIVESIDDIRSDLSELMHLELSKDTNDGDRETTQNIIGVDHLSQEVVQEDAQRPEVQDLSLNVSVSKTDTRRKSTTNLHLEMDIAATAVNVRMLIDDADRGHLKPDQHLALDMCYSKSLGDLVHHHVIPDSQFGQTESDKPASGLYDSGMLLDSKVHSDHVGLTKVNVKVHVQEPPSEGLGTVGHEKLLTYSGLVNPGFKPEDDDDEAIYMTKQLKDSYPVEVWSHAPAEAYNYDSGLPEIKIDDGYSDLGDTNDDIRDFRCGDEAVDAVEEIDPLVNEEAEGGDKTGCEVDTNQDMRPVCENIAAFDHLSSEVTGEKRVDICSRSNTQVDCGLSVSDINVHFSVSNNSLKIDLALKPPDSPCLSENSRLDNLPIADCSSCAMKIEERPQTDGALNVQCPCQLKGYRDQAVLHESLTGAAAHLYADELYVNTDEGGSVEPTIDATGESWESLHYAFPPRVDRHSDANEGLGNGSPPAVYESHECTSCQNFMLSNRKGKLSVTVEEVGGLNCGPRNKKTVTRSTHLDCPASSLHPDIHVQKTMIVPTCSERGEISSAFCTCDIVSASGSLGAKKQNMIVPTCSELGKISSAFCTCDIVSASGSLGAVANENVAGSSAHASDWTDMAACAVTCFDTVFWVCLVVVIILFEMYKCYWLFLLPSCLFILSVLVSDNPKPND